MKIDNLEAYLTERVGNRQPRSVPVMQLAQAGVLIAITDEPSPSVVLTLRAGHLSSHQGEVAFPGGKRDPEDESIIATALREAQEEIGLNPNQVRIIGTLDQVVSRFGYQVTPVLGIIAPNLSFVANLEELDAVFHVPLETFRRQPDSYFERGTIRLPSWDFDGYHIWGLTALMLAEMMNNLWDCDIRMQ
ncbi:MAG: CoA pyrophosphatase, partial [Oleibacter sp.]|nr:CoA pyrophosphatase [Thalassolituus sp.]